MNKVMGGVSASALLVQHHLKATASPSLQWHETGRWWVILRDPILCSGVGGGRQLHYFLRSGLLRYFLRWTVSGFS